MKHSILFLFIAFQIIVFCQTPQEILKMSPNNDDFVYDFGNFLSGNEKSELKKRIRLNFDSTGTQIVVLTVTDLNGLDPNQFTTELGEKWKVGEAKEDNGVILFLSKNDKKSYIATGRGVEGALPDLLAKRILQEVMKPLLSNGQYNLALNYGLESIVASLAGEGFKNTRNPGFDVGFIIFIVIFILIVIFINKNKGGGTFISGRGARNYNPGGGMWFPGAFGGGGFGRGGGSGGGFGGFGGGSFGGGGAGGDW